MISLIVFVESCGRFQTLWSTHESRSYEFRIARNQQATGVTPLATHSWSSNPTVFMVDTLPGNSFFTVSCGRRAKHQTKRQTQKKVSENGVYTPDGHWTTENIMINHVFCFEGSLFRTNPDGFQNVSNIFKPSSKPTSREAGTSLTKTRGSNNVDVQLNQEKRGDIWYDKKKLINKHG